MQYLALFHEYSEESLITYSLSFSVAVILKKNLGMRKKSQEFPMRRQSGRKGKLLCLFWIGLHCVSCQNGFFLCQKTPEEERGICSPEEDWDAQTGWYYHPCSFMSHFIHQSRTQWHYESQCWLNEFLVMHAQSESVECISRVSILAQTSCSNSGIKLSSWFRVWYQYIFMLFLMEVIQCIDILVT